MKRTALLFIPLFLVPACPGDDNGGDAASRFFLPTGDEARNTSNPTIETDADGRIHAVYPAYAIGDAFYATCAADCDGSDDVSVVRFDTEGTVANAMIALGRDGKPHVLLSTFLDVYYARCTGDCTTASGWDVDVILSHDGDLEVTGEAFALTPDDRPRFVMHSYRAFPTGGPTPATYYVTCDASCGAAASWSVHPIADQVWQESTLRFTAGGAPRLATIARVDDGDLAAYIECNGDCTDGASWIGQGLVHAYSDRWVAEIDPAISMDLTASEGPRVSILGRGEDGKPNVTWFECDDGCTTEAGWRGTILVYGDELGAGLDVVLDADDHPRLVYTAGSSILLAHCDAADCTPEGAPWGLTSVELSSDMEPDEVIPYPNCTVSAWFLRHPSIALGADGLPRVAYRAEDISGGWQNPDPTDPECTAGADMTFARFARVSSLE